MSVKVIPGISRASINFILKNWLGLVVVSILPMAIIFALSILMYLMFVDILGFLPTVDFKNPQATAEVMQKYFMLLPILFAMEIVGLFAMAWLFVRIIRFWNNGEANILAVSKGEFSAAAFTILYGIGIGMLTMLAYFAVIIIALILGLIIYGLGTLFFALYFLLIPLAIGAYFSLFWFSCRFYVGMPAVALGEAPDFFTELWTLSRGESFAVPLRLLVSLIIICIPFYIISFALLLPNMNVLQDAIKNLPDHQLSPEMLSRMWRVMFPVEVFVAIFEVVIYVYFSVFFAEVYSRFRAKPV